MKFKILALPCCLCLMILVEGSFLELKMMKEMMDRSSKPEKTVVLKGNLLPPLSMGFNFPSADLVPFKHHRPKHSFERKSDSKIIKVPYPLLLDTAEKDARERATIQRALDKFLYMKLFTHELKTKEKRYRLKMKYKAHKAKQLRDVMRSSHKFVIPVPYAMNPQLMYHRHHHHHPKKEVKRKKKKKKKDDIDSIKIDDSWEDEDLNLFFDF